MLFLSKVQFETYRSEDEDCTDGVCLEFLCAVRAMFTVTEHLTEYLRVYSDP